jgi:SAM-dependent methyltransferase
MQGLVELYRAEAMPLFQNVTYATREEATSCATGDVVLVQDLATGLVFNRAFEPARIVFDARYQNEQGLSTAFKAHLAEVARIVVSAAEGGRVVEIGCGKGTFLSMLEARGLAVSGFDPAYEGDDPAVVRALFTGEEPLSAELVVLRHVLEHIADPMAFLARIAAAGRGKGRIYIEVPCLDWILAHRAWFDVFYEHVNYFRLADFMRMFGTVRAAGHLFGGQYIYVVADLASLRMPRFEAGAEVRIPDDFTAGLAQAGRLAEGAVVWGGASKGVVFTLMVARSGHPVAAVVDINPAKQHRFLPCTGLEVLPPEAGLARLGPGGSVLVVNGNYLAEIAAQVGWRARCVAIDGLGADEAQGHAARPIGAV